MFYCDPCGKKRDWPLSLAQSHGPCEMCRKTTLCNDVPSSALPKPKPKKAS
jgi:hypothetical protein